MSLPTHTHTHTHTQNGEFTFETETKAFYKISKTYIHCNTRQTTAQGLRGSKSNAHAIFGVVALAPLWRS